MADSKRNPCRCKELGLLVKELEREGIERSEIKNLANENGFNASRFGREYIMANAVYAIVSVGLGGAVAVQINDWAGRLGFSPDIPRLLASSFAGLATTALVYTKAYIDGLLCGQNKGLYNFLEATYRKKDKKIAK